MFHDRLRHLPRGLLRLLRNSANPAAAPCSPKGAAAQKPNVEAAQKAVNELKTQSSVDVALPYLTADANGPKHLEARLTREMIEELVK